LNPVVSFVILFPFYSLAIWMFYFLCFEALFLFVCHAPVLHVFNYILTESTWIYVHVCTHVLHVHAQWITVCAFIQCIRLDVPLRQTRVYETFRMDEIHYTDIYDRYWIGSLELSWVSTRT
jgi:hypothetical protein